MNHDLLKLVINDQQQIVKDAKIVERSIDLEKNGNYVLVGPRRAGKSTFLYKIAQNLVESGLSWKQIIFVNFDDDRLLEFKASDFEDIVLVAKEMCGEAIPYYFLDEIQNIDGWEHFALRMANMNQKVYITGSNAKMLSREIEARLGGRYLSKTIFPYDFREYLRANNVSIDEVSTTSLAQRNALLKQYFVYGGFPATLQFSDKKEYISSIYQKILLGDIVTRNNIRGINGIRILMKKIAETIGSDVSYTRLSNTMKTIGFQLAKDSIIDYCSYAKDAYLLFSVYNYYAAFIDKESNPKFYFSDNGLLNLFLLDKETALLENLVAISLKRKYQDDLYYIKSSKTGIDVDFFLPEERTAIQVCYSLQKEETFIREVENLLKLAKNEQKVEKLWIVTYEEKKTIEVKGKKIEIIPLLEFLMMVSK